MLSQTLTLTESDESGRGLGAESPPPGVPLANAGILSPQFLPISPPPPPVAPCCSCSSLLPRLLAAHRLEVRRLLRGALTSLGRRLDTLERRSRGKGQRRRKSRRGGAPAGSSTSTCSTTSSYKSTPLPCVSTSSSANGYKSPPSSFRQSDHRTRCSEEDLVSSRRRRRKNHEEPILLANSADSDEKEKKGGRFVGQMAAFFRGGDEKQELLILQNVGQNQHRENEGGASPAEGAVGLCQRRNGSSHYQSAMVVLQTTGSQSDATVSSSQWHFSDIITFISSNQRVLEHWLITPPSHTNSAPVLHLSASAMEAMLDWVRGEASWSPFRHLRDWTPPPSLGMDHWYNQTFNFSPTVSDQRHQKQRANHITRSLCLPQRRNLPLPPCSSEELSGACPADQSSAVSGFLSPDIELVQRVSQIRIRRASPKETPLTPMGLPKVKRLKKKEFSLEEIYTNKNYKPPPLNRSLETIFEVPREKDGALLLIGQQKRRRLLFFPDFTQPRKRKKPQGAGFPVFMTPRKRAAVRRHLHTTGLDGGGDPDAMLVERLSSLENFLTERGLHM
ncbi:transcript variant X1 [Nothobranchius furzeri]|uniref:Transcript variant X1 n=1 Tax=Nothobranchius furzeri TaxID=105023 RepID=A0A9D2YCE4_NOTFU|nr:transcript variant X2 [Nothobranchius furzeri]KAF7217588.1 transcript variant X1 [Nothobranchius furzeri]